jgi:hypothetical protein
VVGTLPVNSAREPVFFTSDDAALKYIKQKEIDSYTRFVQERTQNRGLTDVELMVGRKIWWKDKDIPFDDSPFVIHVLGKDVKRCQHGPQRSGKLFRNLQIARERDEHTEKMSGGRCQRRKDYR